VVLLPPITNKQLRADVHRLFKALPGFPRMETDTVEPPAAGEAAEQRQGPQQQQQGGIANPANARPLCIELRLATSGEGEGGRGRKRKRRDEPDWPGGKMRYTKFVLYKENMDTHVS
jgi:hypothetical protein